VLTFAKEGADDHKKAIQNDFVRMILNLGFCMKEMGSEAAAFKANSFVGQQDYIDDGYLIGNEIQVLLAKKFKALTEEKVKASK